MDIAGSVLWDTAVPHPESQFHVLPESSGGSRWDSRSGPRNLGSSRWRIGVATVRVLCLYCSVGFFDDQLTRLVRQAKHAAARNSRSFENVETVDSLRSPALNVPISSPRADLVDGSRHCYLWKKGLEEKSSRHLSANRRPHRERTRNLSAPARGVVMNAWWTPEEGKELPSQAVLPGILCALVPRQPRDLLGPLLLGASLESSGADR